jgi:hypothetical protein
MIRRSHQVVSLCLLAGTWTPALALSPPQNPPGWIALSDKLDPATWRVPHGSWYLAGMVQPDPADPRRLKGTPGADALVNGPTGKTSNLVSTQEFADLEVECEFLIPQGSNSGLKLQGLYEIQIYDCYGKQHVTASDCGGVYPRAELLPSYHHIDKGYPPRVNAARPAGEWQSLHILFRAPRFDAGLKIQNARFDRVELNGVLVQENLELLHPTGHAWKRPERPQGPLLIQADHGPVAIRNLRVRPLPPNP